MNKVIYLDNAATTRTAPEVAEAYPDFYTPGQDLALPFIIDEPDCIFQTAVMDLTTGTANISKAAVSDIKKQTSLLIYGSSEDTHNFSASKVIIVRYE